MKRGFYYNTLRAVRQQYFRRKFGAHHAVKSCGYGIGILRQSSIIRYIPFNTRKLRTVGRIFRYRRLSGVFIFYFAKELYSSALSDSSPEVADASDSSDVSDELSDSRASVSAVVSVAVVSDGIFAILAVIIPSTLSAFTL